jgi:UDP-MurNAc hydroxylase
MRRSYFITGLGSKSRVEVHDNTIEIKYYGHACIYIRTKNLSLVTDPWLSKEGAFLWSWFQFPDNTEVDLTPLQNVDYVFLSHEHQDHCDLNFLKTLNPKTKIVIPKYTDSYLYSTLKQNVKNEIIVANSQQKIKLDDEVTFCPVVQSVPHWDDCTLVFETPKGTVVDINDMHIIDKDLEWIKDNFKINYLFIQYSGASWHPYVYDYPHEKKVSLAQKKVINKFLNVKRIFESCKPDFLIPCAGPPCFLDDEQFDLNFSDESVFPSQADFYQFAKKEGLADKTVILLPGDTFDPSQDCVAVSQKNLEHEAFTDKRKYLERYKTRRQDTIKKRLSALEHSNGNLEEKFRHYFEPLIKSSSYFREKIGGKVLFEIVNGKDEKIIVDFSNSTNPVKPLEDDKFFAKFRIDSRFINLILEKKLSWEQLFLSLRFKASRDPDKMNAYLFTFLRFVDPTTFNAFEIYETGQNMSETFILEHDDKKYEVQKWCPHAMGNLSKGRIVDNCIVCPNHGWSFSLNDGLCLYNKSSIKIRKIS